jgi:hypothetical protein
MEAAEEEVGEPGLVVRVIQAEPSEPVEGIGNERS